MRCGIVFERVKKTHIKINNEGGAANVQKM